MSKPHNMPKVERWTWVLDVLFGAIAAIALEKYEPLVRAAWSAGLNTFLTSVFVAICVGSFFAYDVVVHHTLLENIPYKITLRGLARFLLDLVMAFILLLILSAGFQSKPSWRAILFTITIWHIAAILWHLLAESKDVLKDKIFKVIGPHVYIVFVYWPVAYLSNYLQSRFSSYMAGWPDVPLILLSAAIMLFSYIRLKQLLEKFRVA